jgi:hypothetical protein
MHPMGPKGRYSVAKLIEKHGRTGNLTRWVSAFTGDCPKRDGRLYAAASCALTTESAVKARAPTEAALRRLRQLGWVDHAMAR